MSRPVIGITGNLGKIENDGVFSGNMRQYIHTDYTESVVMGGGTPLVLPVVSDDEAIRLQVGLCDGIILSGGADIDTQLYNEEPLPGQGYSMRETDEYDLKVLRYAVEMKKPVLGICKGLQIMNVCFGGTLYQDIPSQRANCLKHTQNAQRYRGTHRINIEEGSLISELLPDGTLVNSWHHQGIKDLAEAFRATAYAEDGITEAIEYKGGDMFMLGVQWHPEMMTACGDREQKKIFESFIEICRRAERAKAEL